MLSITKNDLIVISYGFFDYDRSLFTHPYPLPGQAHPTYKEECKLQLYHQEEVQGGDEPLRCMQWLVQQLRDDGAKCAVLTHEIFNLRSILKQQSAKHYYGIDTYFEVNTAAHKIDLIQAIAEEENIPLRQCLLVDDKMETIYDACAAGITGLHISNVMRMYESFLHSKGLI